MAFFGYELYIYALVVADGGANGEPEGNAKHFSNPGEKDLQYDSGTVGLFLAHAIGWKRYHPLNTR